MKYHGKGKMPTSTGGAPKDTPDGGARRPHPNGGEVRSVPAESMGRMPARQSRAPVTHTPLPTGGDFAGLGKMPKNMSGGRERDPVRR